MSHDPHTSSPADGDAQPNYKLPFTIPTWLIYLLVLAVVVSWVPLALIARSRASHSHKPRVHIFQDMDVQPRFGPQAWAGPNSAQLADPLFADSRAMRMPVPGAVAASDDAAKLDDHYYRGYKTDGNLKPKLKDLGEGKFTLDDDAFLAGFPERVTVDRALLERGRDRYNIYCAVCHGESGYGDGPVQRRLDMLLTQSAELGTPSPVNGWAPPRNLHMPNIVAYPEGRIFHVASEGYASMRGYKQQVPVADRWAIVAWVRVLQASKRVPIETAITKFGVTDAIIEKMPPAPEPPTLDIPGLTFGTDEPPAPEPWLGDAALVAQGKTLFQAKLCATCHQIDPTLPTPLGVALNAPKFMGKFWGLHVTVRAGVAPDGQKVNVYFNAPYVMHSIAEPMTLIRDGSIAGMAPLPTTEDERKALAAYLHSLSE